MVNEVRPRIRCRQIADADVPALIDLLTHGFGVRPVKYWANAFEQLAKRDAPAGYPRYGYMIEEGGRAVGVLLMIFSQWPDGDALRKRCNISSWYVEPDFRGYASLLIAAAVRYKEVTYINVSPAPHTWPVIEAQGFSRYCDGQMLTLPLFSPAVANTRVSLFDAGSNNTAGLTQDEIALLTYHVEHGCVAYLVHENEAVHPFLFLPRRIFHGLAPTLQLIYCRDVADFPRLAGPLGRAAALRGDFTILVDANGPIPGMVGRYVANRGPKYFKGPERPRIGDLAFCEAVLFGP